MGSGGSHYSSEDLAKIERLAKKEIKSFRRIKRNVFISFSSDDLNEVIY